MENQGHSSGVILSVDWDGQRESKCALTWNLELTDQIRLANADEVECVEDSARAIAFLLVRDNTEYTVIRQAKRFGGWDYYLGKQDGSDTYIFGNISGDDAAILEVSGICRGSAADIKRRIKEKLKRFVSLDDLPFYVIVVEHSAPVAKVVVKS